MDIERRLQEAGIKPTAQRLTICRYVLEEANHPTADDVKSWMDQNFPKVSLATVYNTLNLLVEHGIVQELRLPHDGRVVFDMNTGPHHHFLDEDTGELVDLDPSQLKVEHRLGSEFDIRQVQAVLIGRKKKR